MIKPIKLVVVYNPKSKRENRKALQDQPQGEEDFAGLTVLPESGRLSKKTHTTAILGDKTVQEQRIFEYL